ncbi:MAG: hypothetical protein ACP5EN_02495 [Rhodovulum sp.]
MNRPTMAALRVLSVAVATGRAGYVFLVDGRLHDWGITVKATKSAKDIAAFVATLIETLRPDIVVTERCDDHCRKGARAQRLIGAIAEAAQEAGVRCLALTRPRTFPSKYEEAVHLADRHPEIAGYLPERKRRIFDFEPRGMILFEALALAEQAILGPPEHLAAAMG